LTQPPVLGKMFVTMHADIFLVAASVLAAGVVAAHACHYLRRSYFHLLQLVDCHGQPGQMLRQN